MQARFGTCLVALAALSAAGAAHGQDQIAGVVGVSSTRDGCVRYVAQQAIVVRCAIVEPEILSDHGTTAAEPYDAQGNPVDRHGNVVAVPAGRSQHREVFAEPRTLR